jgi:hypothetical protein
VRRHMLGQWAIAALGLALLALPASAAETSRGEYVDVVEPICKRATLANRGILRGVETMIRKGKLQRAADRFIRAATALESVIGKLAPVPRPASDAERLSEWLRHARKGAALLRRIGNLLKEDRRAQAERLAPRLLREARRANATVVGFDFNYCRLNPARFA